MSLNKFVSLESSEPINMRIKALEIESDTLKTNTISSISGADEIYLLATQMKMARDPTDDQDLATKYYVDTAVAGGGGGSGVSNPMVENLNANGYNITAVNELFTNSLGGQGENDITLYSDIQCNTQNIKGANYVQTDQLYSSTAGDIAVENPLNLQNNNKIKNLVSGTDAGDAVNKGQLDSEISTLTSSISTNTANITQNSSDIDALQIQQQLNTTNISNNEGNINANAITIGTNTTDIATNTANIATNTANITQNTNSIATINSTLATKATIDDNVTATNTTWSSDKISTEITNSASNIDFTGLDGSVDKVNLSLVSSQPVKGLNSLYTISGANVSVGQPLIQNFTNGVITASGIGGVPPAWKFIGVATNTTMTGNNCNIVYDGFCTARYTTITQPATSTINLNNVTNNTTSGIRNLTTFRDSGGQGGSYGASELYNITFDAGEGRTINYNINLLSFEHTNTRLYDRLGWQFSSDGVNFFNPVIAGFHTTNSITPPYGTYYLNNNVRGSDTTGNVFPQNITILTGAGGSQTGSTGYRYVKFFFNSDSSSQLAGWEIELTPSTPYPTDHTPVPVDTPLYLDPNDLTKVSTDNANNFLVGYCAYENTNNDSIYMHVLSQNA